MTVEVDSLYNKPFSISKSIPAEFQTYIIPGSEISYGNTRAVKLLLQQITFGSLCIAYFIFHIEDDESFLITSHTTMLYSFISINRDIDCINNEQTVTIKESRCNIFFHPDTAINLMLHKKGEYIALILFYTKEFMLQQLTYFPALESFKSSIIQNKNSIGSLKEIYVSIKMFDCIHQLLHSPYSQATQRFHADIIKRLLKFSLREIAAHSNESQKFSLEYLESLYAAKHHIDNRLLEHDTISTISRKVGINELKLKKGFKEIFGVGVYGYRKRERLRIAKGELEQTRKSIKQVAKIAGYKSANNFSIAFKKIFGVTPQSMRNKI